MKDGFVVLRREPRNLFDGHGKNGALRVFIKSLRILEAGNNAAQWSIIGCRRIGSKSWNTTPQCTPLFPKCIKNPGRLQRETRVATTPTS